MAKEVYTCKEELAGLAKEIKVFKRLKDKIRNVLMQKRVKKLGNILTWTSSPYTSPPPDKVNPAILSKMSDEHLATFLTDCKPNHPAYILAQDERQRRFIKIKQWYEKPFGIFLIGVISGIVASLVFPLVLSALVLSGEKILEAIVAAYVGWHY